MRHGDWWHSVDHGEACQILTSETLWGRSTFLVWLPRRGASVRVQAERLEPLSAKGGDVTQRLSYAASAARIADTLQTDVLVAPLEGKVTPLPHQLRALRRAVSGDRVRYLLADEVGLGKTIEAGLVIRELKIRGLVKRVLIVAPSGLALQWVSEMRNHFDESFDLMVPGAFPMLRQATGHVDGDNLWRLHDQVICPLDSVKPVDTRKGWSQERLERYNKERFEDLVGAGWDLVVIDEAHRLAGSTDQVSRYKLGEALAQAAPYLLLLSATPHQGKTDGFRRLIGLLDRDAISEDQPMTRELVGPFVIRTEKRHAIDAAGQPLFKPRYTQLIAIDWDAKRSEHQALYDAVTAYVRDGYNRALKEKQTAVGFLMILMQRLVSSSTAAIRTALQRRLEVLSAPNGGQAGPQAESELPWSEEDLGHMDELLGLKRQGVRNERKEVETLLDAARRCENFCPDIKAEELMVRIDEMRREDGDINVKVLIFTEFVPTQAMLHKFLTDRGFDVVVLNGSMDIEERRTVQQRFASDAQVLVSTDAGGEGLNLQFCHVIVNYDLPWNPMKLEQRIGRVDRIGQAKVVRALNLALKDSVELRVREVLAEKLQTILAEFGVDKLADVLDSEEGGVSFEALFAQAIIDPEEAERRAAEFVDEIRSRATLAHEAFDGLIDSGTPDTDEARRLLEHQMPYWTERMTISYLGAKGSQGAAARKAPVGYDLTWEDGFTVTGAVFRKDDARSDSAKLLTLSDQRLRTMVSDIPVHAPGQPLATIIVDDVSDKTSGTWSLWRVQLNGEGRRDQRFIPIFVSANGRPFSATARLVWDQVIASGFSAGHHDDAVTGSGAVEAYEQARAAAEQAGAGIFGQMSEKHAALVAQERAKKQRAHEGRRSAAMRIGLPSVRDHRLKLLNEEERLWREESLRLDASVPELVAVAMVQVRPSEAHQ